MAETDAQTQEVCLALRLVDGDGAIGVSDLLAVVTPLRRAVRALGSAGPKAGRPTDELGDATELSLRLAAGSTTLTFAPSTDAALSLAPGACKQLVEDLRSLERSNGEGPTPPLAYAESLAELLGAVSRLGRVHLGTTIHDLSPLATDAARAALRWPSDDVTRLTAVPVGAGWGTRSRLVRRGGIVTGANYAAMCVPDLTDDEAKAFLHAIDDL